MTFKSNSWTFVSVNNGFRPTGAVDLKESQLRYRPFRRVSQVAQPAVVVFMWHTKCISFIKLQICNARQVWTEPKQRRMVTEKIPLLRACLVDAGPENTQRERTDELSGLGANLRVSADYECVLVGVCMWCLVGWGGSSQRFRFLRVVVLYGNFPTTSQNEHGWI